MKSVVQVIAAALLLVAERTLVSTSPLPDKVSARGLDELANTGIGTKDQDVKDLERLKPIGSLAVVKTHSSIYTNINGREKQMAQTREEVDKDGAVLARVEQQVDKSGENEPQIKTSLDIPARNIHKVIMNRPKDTSNTVDLQARGPAGLRYSPADMAEYVFWTGDEKGVTSAIEEYLEAGMITREDAIDFLQEIKRHLEQMQSQFIDHSPDSTLKGQYDERPLFSKKSLQDTLSNYAAASSLNNPNMMASMLPAEEDYEDLIEKLKMSDYLYNEYSLEEVIYQLAKVMFTQSLSRGSVEAQDALQKVTGFLDSEAQQGKITRSIEKKVLSVLISALSDTLTEHPELVNTARESLGIPQPEPLVHRLLPQGSLKKAEEMSEGLKHRFQGTSGHNMKRTIQDSGLKDDTTAS